MNKGRKFVHLSEEERIKIEVLLQQGLSLSSIAGRLNRPVSTISREVGRNGPKRYTASRAQYFTALRHRNKAKHCVFDEEMKLFIEQQLTRCKWSPEIISWKGRAQRSDFVSPEWIYQWIWAMKFSMAQKDKGRQGLYQHLKHGKRRRRRGRKTNMRGNILHRKWIDERPVQANERKRQGDLEADIVLGRDRQPGLLVVIDRKSRKTWLRKLKTKDAGYVISKLTNICRSVGNVKSVTLDNDQSFAEHYKLQQIGIPTFFTHPYSSQEKGSVENRIGIIRMFLPKKTDFRLVNDQQVRNIEKMINQRPVRMFKYRSPDEVHATLSNKKTTFAFIT